MDNIIGTVDTDFAAHDAETRASLLEQQLAASASEIENLKLALESARTISAAVGIIMALEKLSYDAAFAVLVSASQHQHRKLRDVADGVMHYGAVVDEQEIGVRLVG